MIAHVKDIIQLMDEIAPPELSESWDNVGLQVGKRDRVVKNVWICLDPTAWVIDAAADRHVDLIVTHHPLFFKPIHRIDLDSITGRAIETAIRHRIAIFSAHTNLDSVTGGLNDLLAQKIGIEAIHVLGPPKDPEKRQGIGRYGILATPESLGKLAGRLMEGLGIRHGRIVGDAGAEVRNVALCTGSAASLIPEAIHVGAQVYIGGDFGYHAARDAEAAGLCLIDIGHFGSEYLMVNHMAERLGEMVMAAGYDVRISAGPLERDPFSPLLGTSEGH